MKTPPSSSPLGDAWSSAEARRAHKGIATHRDVPATLAQPLLDRQERSAICDRYIEKLNALQDLLVQDSSIVMERMLKLPEGKREGVARELGKRHILQALLQPQGGQPGAWKALAGLGEEFERLSADKQASRLLWREMEWLVKSATDLSKTEAEYNLLIRRVWEYKSALGKENTPSESPRTDPRSRVDRLHPLQRRSAASSAESKTPGR